MIVKKSIYLIAYPNINRIRMKKFFTISLSLLIFAAQAGEVSKKEAIKVANNFYFERNAAAEELRVAGNFTDDIHTVMANNNPAFYYINFDDEGWVVVSGHTSTRPIIAYSYTGRYSPDYEPDNFRAWMSQYISQIIEVVDNNITQTPDIKKLWDYYLSDDIELFKDDTAIPIACAAIPILPPSKVANAILNPSPSFPIMFSLGTFTSLKINE